MAAIFFPAASSITGAGKNLLYSTGCPTSLKNSSRPAATTIHKIWVTASLSFLKE
jgi:hypothetical protein